MIIIETTHQTRLAREIRTSLSLANNLTPVQPVWPHQQQQSILVKLMSSNASNRKSLDLSQFKLIIELREGAQSAAPQTTTTTATTSTAASRQFSQTPAQTTSVKSTTTTTSATTTTTTINQFGQIGAELRRISDQFQASRRRRRSLDDTNEPRTQLDAQRQAVGCRCRCSCSSSRP